ncbi:sugar phosphate isomerase/epimerase family protein [Desulfarculus baarsii]
MPANNDHLAIIWLCLSRPGPGPELTAARALRQALEGHARTLILGPEGSDGVDLRLGRRLDLGPALEACPDELRPAAVICLGAAIPAGLELAPCPCLAWGPATGCDQTLPAPADQAAEAAMAALGRGPRLSWLAHVQVNMPLGDLLGRYEALARSAPVNLEIGLDASALDSCGPAEMARAKAIIAGRRITAHLPFMDLYPAAADPLVAAAAARRLEMAVTTALELGAIQAVGHLGFWPMMHRDVAAFAARHATAMTPIAQALAAGGCRLVLENTMEPDPAPLLACRRALSESSGVEVGFCLDVGHANSFSRTSLPAWWRAMESHLWEMHLHDNDGSDDSHYPPGSGRIDWAFIAEGLRGLSTKPILTLEPHTEAHFWASLRGLERLWGRPEA